MLKKIFAKRETPLSAGIENTIFSFGSMFLNFLKSMLIAFLFGASNITDIYYAALNILQTPISILTFAVNALIIPQYQKEKDKSFFIRSFSLVIFFIFGILLIGYIIFNQEIIQLIYSGFSGDKQLEISKILLILSPAILFLPFNYFFDNVLKSDKFLIYGNLARLAGSITNIIVLLVLIKFEFFGIAVAYTVGQLVILMITIFPVVKKHKLAGKANILGGFSHLKNIFPLLVGGIMGMLIVFYEKNLASYFSEGTITVLSMSFTLTNMVKTLFVSTIISAFYPFISESITHNKPLELKKYILQSKKLIFGLIGVLVIFSISFSYPAINIVYGHGKFTHESVILLYKLFNIYASSLLIYSAFQIQVYILYSKSMTYITLLTNNFLTPALNIFLLYVFVKPDNSIWIWFSSFTDIQPIGFYGIPLATGISHLFSLFVSEIIVRKKLHTTVFNIKDILIMIIMVSLGVFCGVNEWNWYYLLFPIIYLVFIVKLIYRMSIKEIYISIKNKMKIFAKK